MDMVSRINEINTKEKLVSFLEYLSKDKNSNKTEWMNDSIEDYLGAISSWVEDMEGYYINNNLTIPDNEKVSQLFTKLRKEFIYVRKYQTYLSPNIDFHKVKLGPIGSERIITEDDLSV